MLQYLHVIYSALCAHYYETLVPTGLDKNTFACFCMRPALPGELWDFCPPWGTVWEFGPHNRALYGIYTCRYMV